VAEKKILGRRKSAQVGASRRRPAQTGADRRKPAQTGYFQSLPIFSNLNHFHPKMKFGVSFVCP
jgi:hypothetical protein